MTVNEFLSRLGSLLSQLDSEERKKQLDYYAELLSDMTEDGMSQADATARLGSPEEAAERIFAEMPISALVRSRVKPKGGWTALNVTLLIVGSPIWLPIAVSLLAVLVSVYVVIWAAIAVLFAAVLSIAAAGLGSIALGVVNFPAGLPAALMLIGGGLVCAGLSIPAYLGALRCAKALVKLTALIARWVKSLFVRKERV